MPQPEPTTGRRFLSVGITPVYVPADTSGSVTVEAIDGTVYYGPSKTTTTVTGTPIAYGDSVTIDSGQYFVAAQPSRLLVDDPSYAFVVTGFGPPTDPSHFDSFYFDLSPLPAGQSLFYKGVSVDQTRDGVPAPPPTTGIQPIFADIQTTDFTLASAMSGYFVRANPSSALSLRIPGSAAPMTAGQFVDVGNEGTATITLVPDNDATLKPGSSVLSIPPGRVARLRVIADGTFSVQNADSQAVAAPVNTLAPTISGDNHVGSVLSIASFGNWNPPAGSTRYQWTAAGTNIGGATNTTYTILVGDVGKVINVNVWATGVGGEGGPAAASNPVTALAAAGSLPTNSALPVITGTLQVSQVLTATSGTWTNTPSTYSYSWAVSPDGSTGWVGVRQSPTSSATTDTYTVAQSDVGKFIRVQTLANNATGQSASPATSASSQIAVSSTSMTSLITSDMGRYIIGSHNTPITPDDSEARPIYAGDWSWRSREKGTDPLSTLRDGTRPFAVAWFVVDQYSSGQPSTAQVTMRDFQLWAKSGGVWSRKVYSVGSQDYALWNYNWSATTSKTSANYSGGGNNPDIIHMGPTPPSGSRTPAGFIFHNWAPAWQTSASDRSGVQQILVACRFKLVSANAGARYLVAGGLDLKNSSYQNIGGGGDIHFKAVPTDGTWRVITGLYGPCGPNDSQGLDLSGTFPSLTGVASTSELY